MKKENPYIVNGEYVTLEEYRKTKFDSFLTRVPKGRKETIQSHAQKQGESLNSFVNRAIDNQIDRDNNTPQTDASIQPTNTDTSK